MPNGWDPFSNLGQPSPSPSFGWSTSSPSIAANSSARLTGSLTPAQNSVQDWLGAQGRAINSQYNSLSDSLYGQLAGAGAYSNYQGNAATQNANLNSALLNQSRFRDVTLGRQSTDLGYRTAMNAYNINQGGINNQLQQAQAVYDQQSNNFANLQTQAQNSYAEEQRYLAQLMGFGVQGYNQANEALNTANVAATRDLGLSNQNAARLLQDAEHVLNLTRGELDSLRKMSGTERDQALADVGAARGFNDQQLAELKRALGVASTLNDADWAEVQRSSAADLAEVQRATGAGRDLTGRQWAEIQRDLGEQRGTSDEQIAIARWLNQQQGGSNDAALDLALRQSAFQEGLQQRGLKSAATTAGARSSVGLGRNLSDVAQLRGLTDEGSRQGWQAQRDQLQAGLRGDENSYQAVLDQLTNAYNRGELGRDTDLEALLGRLNQGQLQNQARLNQGSLAYQQGNETITGQRNQGQLAYDVTGRGLDERSRNANTQYQNAMTQYMQQQDRAQAQYMSQWGDISARQQAGANQYQDIIDSINQQRQGNWLGFQQNYAGLENRGNTNELNLTAARQGINNQALMAQLGLQGTQAGLNNQSSLLANQQAQARGQYNIDQRTLDSLSRTYGTRSAQNSAGLSQALEQLRYQQSQNVLGTGQQQQALAAQQQQALAQLFAQAYGGY